MVSIGSKALPSRTLKTVNLIADCLMADEVKNYKHGRKEKGMARKAKKGTVGFDGDNTNKNHSGRASDGTTKGRRSFQQQSSSEPQTSFVRKQVDPETAKYFLEIANVFESNEVDLEERSVICSNALEETRGKELELATDYIISHTMQTLLESCDVDNLCGFLRSSAKTFPSIAMDRSGSHVAETALSSLAKHLQDTTSFPVIEEAVTKICKVIVDNPVDVMCNCHGSHVLRRLLCLCGGVSMDSTGRHGANSSTVLAGRLNFKASRFEVDDSQNGHEGFPDLLNVLISGIINVSRQDIKTLQVDQFSSLVLQTALKLLVGQDEKLLQVIPIILGCNKKKIEEGNYIETQAVGRIMGLMKETAFSHLMEVILEVAPESLYNDMFNKVFRHSLFDLSSDQCGNFVVQALISHAKVENQVELIWEEIGPKFRDLLEAGRSGVIASLIAASQRLQSHENKCCQALAVAMCSTNEPPTLIVPRILFLDSYFRCGDKSNWSWPAGVKMHVMGSLILQEIFRFQIDIIQPFITSITCMGAEHVFETAKDSAGARVLEAFLDSNASAKHKRRLVMKLRGYFGELSLRPSGSYTVEKCFTVSNLSLREAIVSDLLSVKTDLFKTKQGPHLLRKFDVDVFASRPDQWRSRQGAKQTAFNEFYAEFGSTEAPPSRKDSFLSDTFKQTSHPQDLKNMRDEIDHHLGSKNSGKSVPRVDRHGPSSEVRENKFSNQRPFLSGENTGKKRNWKDASSQGSYKRSRV